MRTLESNVVPLCLNKTIKQNEVSKYCFKFSAE